MAAGLVITDFSLDYSNGSSFLFCEACGGTTIEPKSGNSSFAPPAFAAPSASLFGGFTCFVSSAAALSIGCIGACYGLLNGSTLVE